MACPSTALQLDEGGCHCSNNLVSNTTQSSHLAAPLQLQRHLCLHDTRASRHRHIAVLRSRGVRHRDTQKDSPTYEFSIGTGARRSLHELYLILVVCLWVFGGLVEALDGPRKPAFSGAITLTRDNIRNTCVRW